MPTPLVREAMLFQARPTSHDADIRVGGCGGEQYTHPHPSHRFLQGAGFFADDRPPTLLRSFRPHIPRYLTDKLPDGILAEHEARRSFRPDAVLGQKLNGRVRPIVGQIPGPSAERWPRGLFSPPNFWHTAESNVETIKIFIFAYLRIVQIV